MKKTIFFYLTPPYISRGVVHGIVFLVLAYFAYKRSTKKNITPQTPHEVMKNPESVDLNYEDQGKNYKFRGL